MENNSLDLVSVGASLLADAKANNELKRDSLWMPIAEITTLGSGVASVVPALNTVTQELVFNTGGLYRLANEAAGDSLKIAKNGNFWGAFHTLDGGSKFAQLKSAESLGAVSKVSAGLNPAMLMMAIALYSLEREIKQISDNQKRIVSFLKNEKSAEIEADVITLTEIVTKYKYNWDNDRYVTSNHKMVCDLQRTARKNMLFYQKEAEDALASKQLLFASGKVNAVLNDMIKRFQYYRLSLYTFALSSMSEIILSGNFQEENINRTVIEIDKCSSDYRELFSKCSEFLEKLSHGALDTALLKGSGVAINSVGKLVGSIPKVKNGQVNGYLENIGTHIKLNADDSHKEVIESFSLVSNPNTGVFVSKLKDMNRIFNHTKEICCDEQNIYLIGD